MSYLKRTGTGINDVTWDETPLATEDYVNTTVTTAVPDGKFVETTGGTMTGELVLSGKPTQDNGAATKKYVDDALGGAAPAGDYVNKSGDTMTGNLNMNNNQITNVNTMTATNIIVKGTSDASASIKVTGDASRSELDLNDASNNPVVLKGVDTPVDNNDAANKQYVDAVDTKVTNLQGEVDGVNNTVTNITNGSTELPYLPIAGGTLTGTLTLSGDPTADLQAATKAYVDIRANDKKQITLVPNTEDGVTFQSYTCFAHNNFIFANIIFDTIPTLPIGEHRLKLFTFSDTKPIQTMKFSIFDNGAGYTASDTFIENITVQIACEIENNEVYIFYVTPAPKTNVVKVTVSPVFTQMFAFIN